MTLTNLTFYIFLPICITIYFIIPSKVRYIWLLICSYYFYCSLDGAFVSLLIISTLITWLCGGAIDSLSSKRAKQVMLTVGILFNVLMLVIYKYENFFLELSGSDKRLNLILPIGISFYTFQSLTYIFDIYKGDLKHEHNVLKYALFVSFFPLILSGPIERAKHLIPQLSKETVFDPERAKDGLKLMLYGYFLKIVIVARMDILTSYVFKDYLNKSSVALIIALFAYTIQIYCDFSGYSAIAIGMCKIMGIDIIENFKRPYFAISVSDFWRRWHISLSTWFRDYLYIPLGGNRKGKMRKYINIIIVFLVSGLWHGANLTFVFWGLLNGLYQVIGDLLSGFKKKIAGSKPFINRQVFYTTLCRIITFLLISFTWIFFRSSSIYEAIDIIKRMFSSFNYVNLFDGTIWNVGLGVKNMLIALVAIIFLLISDILCEKKNCNVSLLLVNQKVAIRWAVYYFMILMILFSMNLNMTEFIYSGF